VDAGTPKPTAWDYDDADMGRDWANTRDTATTAAISRVPPESDARSTRTGGLGFAVDTAVRDFTMQSYGLIGRDALAPTTQVFPLRPEPPIVGVDLTDYVPDSTAQAQLRATPIPSTWRDSVTAGLRWWADGIAFNEGAKQGFIDQGLHALRGMAEFGVDTALQAIDGQTYGAYEDVPLFRDAIARQQARADALFSFASHPITSISNALESVGTRLGEGFAMGGRQGGYVFGGATFDAANMVIGGASLPRAIVGAYDSGAAITSSMAETLRGAGVADWNVRPIQGALGSGPLPPFEIERIVAPGAAVSPRYLPGVVTQSGELEALQGAWLRADEPSPIPGQVAQSLVGRQFNTFADLQAAIWEGIAADPELNVGFGRASLSNMLEGNAPFAPPAYQNAQFGGRFNLHHVEPIGSGGAVYDLSNLSIVSPRIHTEIHYPKKP
jgi:hypothetical protein